MRGAGARTGSCFTNTDGDLLGATSSRLGIRYSLTIPSTAAPEAPVVKRQAGREEEGWAGAVENKGECGITENATAGRPYLVDIFFR